MKALFIGWMLCLSAVCVKAQSDTKLEQALESLRKNMLDPDSLNLLQLTGTTLSYGHSSGKVENRQEFIHALLSGSSDFVTLDISAQSIQLYKKFAVVRHTLSAANNDNGKAGNIKLTVMQVWEKQAGEWKLIARQAGKIL